MQNIKVQCLVAYMDDAGGDPLLAAAKDAMDASCKLPAGYESPWPQIVLATLDINQGEGSSCDNHSLACPCDT